MSEYKRGDHVKRIQITREFLIPIESIGIVLESSSNQVYCNWDQPENKGLASRYWVPEQDIVMVEPLEDPPPIADFFLALRKEE